MENRYNVYCRYIKKLMFTYMKTKKTKNYIIMESGKVVEIIRNY